MQKNTGPPTAEQMLLVQGIYERYRAMIYKFAKGRTRDESEADDVVSETLLRLFRNADKLRDMHEGEIIDYTVQTVLSAAGDLNRKHRSEQRRFRPLDEEDLPDYEPDPAERYTERETELRLRRHLWETLSELKEADRVLLVGKYLEERSDEALARQLGVKAASIRMKLTRARARARKIMQRKEVGDE